MIGDYMATQANKKTKTEELSTEISTYPHQSLLDALYFIWDAAERGQLQIFLVGDTAKQVINGGDLSGDYIAVGVRKNEWNSGQGRITQEFLSHEIPHGKIEFDDEREVYIYNEVPIEVKLYDENPCLTSFDIVYYGYETFNLPNPYKTFVEKYE